MEAVYFAAGIIAALFILTQLFGIFSLLLLYKKYPLLMEEEPFVSILVAARNEEKIILRCLESLSSIDYPPDKIEILIGNDQSEDKTAEVVRKYIAAKPAFRLIDIKGQLGKAKGKANVLAQLAREARGKFLLITDADIRVQYGWVRSILGAFDERTGTVSGTTIMEGSSRFALVQRMEWTYYMGMIKAVAGIGIPATGVGNNMAVRRGAYDSVGGYEAIDFSVTEDYKLFREIRKKGWKWKQLMQPESLNISLPVQDLDTFFKQRRRWMAGAGELPFYWWIVFMILALFYPAVIVIMLGVNFKLGLSIWLTKFALQNLLLLMQLENLKQPYRLPDSMLFEIYSIFNAFVTPCIHLIRRRVSWKGRTY